MKLKPFLTAAYSLLLTMLFFSFLIFFSCQKEKPVEIKKPSILILQNGEEQNTHNKEIESHLINIISYLDPQYKAIESRMVWRKEPQAFSTLSPRAFIEISRESRWNQLFYYDIIDVGEYHSLLILSNVNRMTNRLKRSGFLVEKSENPNEDILLIPMRTKPADVERPLICLDPGHGGLDSGAIARDGTEEKELNSSLAIEMAAELHARGYRVIFSRSPFHDTEFLPTDERASRINDLSPDLLISLHHNYSSLESHSGFCIFYSSFKPNLDKNDVYVLVDEEKRPFLYQRRRGRLSEVFYEDENGRARSMDDLPWYVSAVPYVRDDTPSNQAIASQYFALLTYFELLEQYSVLPFHYTEGSLIEDRDYAILRLTDVPSILIEAGFMTNPEDLSKLQDRDVQTELVYHIADAVDLYFGSEKKLGNENTIFF